MAVPRPATAEQQRWEGDVRVPGEGEEIGGEKAFRRRKEKGEREGSGVDEGGRSTADVPAVQEGGDGVLRQRLRFALVRDSRDSPVLGLFS